MAHIFTIGEDVWERLPLDQIKEEAKLLREHGLYELPYPENVYVRVSRIACLQLIEMPETRTEEELQSLIKHMMAQNPQIQRTPEEWREFAMKDGNRKKLIAPGCEFRRDFENNTRRWVQVKVDDYLGPPPNIFFAEKVPKHYEAPADDPRYRFDPTRREMLVGEIDSIIGRVESTVRLIANARDALVAILNTQNVDRTIDGKSPALQRALGMKPSGDVVTILSISAAMKRASQGGTHASPRMHWRRSHFRTLASGESVRVSAAFINLNAETRANRAGYVIKTK